MYDAEVHVVKLRDVVPGDFYVAKNDKRYMRTVIALADNKLMLLTGTGNIHTCNSDMCTSVAIHAWHSVAK